MKRVKLYLLNTWNDEGPATDDDQRSAVEAAGDNDGLVGAAGDEAHPAHLELGASEGQ